MTQKEILDREADNTGSIWLYLEGSFYKAYERSAFAFCTRIREYKTLRKESKTLGRDILYVGFPMTSLERTLSQQMAVQVDDRTIRVVLSYPISDKDFMSWRDAQEVEMASRALISPYTRVIEKTPLYKTSYDILSQVILVSKNISRNCQNPFAIEMKRLSYRASLLVRSLYDVTGQERARTIESITDIYNELSFLLQLMKDSREISINSFALLSEQIISVEKQLSLLQRKVTCPVPAERD